MSHFSIMLVPDTGRTRAYRLSKGKLKLISSLMLLFTAIGAFGIYSIYLNYDLRQRLNVSLQTLQEERQNFATTTVAFEAERHAEATKLNVYARTIGQMQARLSRLDALGKRLVQSSSLNESEFDFNVQPAFGGPRSLAETNMPEAQLFDQVQRIGSHIASLDTQLVAIDYLLQDKAEEKLARPHAWPSEGGWLSSRFGIRTDPFTAKKARHLGIDIANRLGAPVLSASRGVVIFAGKMKDYGYLVEIEHGYGYRTRYGHMSAMSVTVGDVIKANYMIGRVGSSGRSTGPHLHYEVRRNNQALDPQGFIPRG